MNTRLILPLVLLSALFMAGCQTTNISGRLLTSSVVTVDRAMKGWAQYVKMGQATPQQEAEVRKAYVKYQAAELAAEQAYFAALKSGNSAPFVQAMAALDAARVPLLQLIATFNPKAKTK